MSLVFTLFRRCQLAAIVLLIGVMLVGCKTVPPLTPANLAAPGWRVQNGQAVWKPSLSRPELAGELLFATRTNGDFLVQFSKPPFSLAMAQMINDQWQIEFGNKWRWKGRGEPPSRFVWFELPHAIAGERLKRNWHFTGSAAEAWRLENRLTGESLEGSFFP